MENEVVALAHGVLVVTEIGQQVLEEEIRRLFRLLGRDRQVEGLQIAEMPGEAPLDEL